MNRILILSLTFIIALSCKKVGYNPSSGSKHIFSLNRIDNISFTKDKGLIISGSSNGKYTLIRTDDSLNIQWIKNNYEWGNLISGSSWGAWSYSFKMVKVFQADNGNYVCIGAISQGGDVIYSSALIIILNQNGEQIQKYTFDDVYLLNALQTNDGYVLFGTQLIKLDKNFNKLWAKDIYNNYTYFPCQITTTDNGFAVTGSYGDQIFLRKFDTNGNELLMQKYKHNDYPFDERGFDVKQLTDNGFLIVGRTIEETTVPGSDIVNCQIIRTNSNGDTIWTKRFGYSTNSWIDNIVSFYNQNEKNEFVLHGSIGYPADSTQNTILIKINSNGEILNSKITAIFPLIVYSPLGLYIKALNDGSGNIELLMIKPDDIFN